MIRIDFASDSKNKILLFFGILFLVILFVLFKHLPKQEQVKKVSVVIPKKIVVLVPIYSVKTAVKKIAISFDACWGDKETPKILAILKKYKVKSTFFLVNIWLKKYPDMARRVVAEGHEIGMHSATHPDFTKLTTEEIKNQIDINHRMIKRTCGYEPQVFRPPFGNYNKKVMTTIGSMGFTTVKWSIDSLDWKGLSANAICKRVLYHVKPGAIVLFHNSGKNTAEAIRSVIPSLLKQGYKIVPVSNLIYKDNYHVSKLGMQIKD